MPPTALLSMTAYTRSAGRKHIPSGATATQTPCAWRSGTRRILRILAVLVGSLVLIGSLVDPLRGSDQFDEHKATHDQGVRHE